MITEDRKSTDDRIPVLGYIPLVGRLFRSQQKLSDKRNLMIFVTAKLVDAAGRPFKKPVKPSFLDEPVSVSVATP